MTDIQELLAFADGPAEVPFCGHATIATACALALRDGPGVRDLQTRSGIVRVSTTVTDGVPAATFSSVEPYVEDLDDTDLETVLGVLGWAADELDRTLPGRTAYAGARHLILAAATRERLARLDYDMTVLAGFMLARDLTTLCLVWREDDSTFHTRNPFPVGGKFEDPATGAASAAFGAYLRELHLVTPPARLVIRQGQDMGRSSTILVDIPPSGPIDITGAAVVLAAVT